MASKNFKGQSLVEYFVTYGWAIFVLAIVLGILFFGGFFRSDFFISEKCELGPNLPCKAVIYNERAGETKVSVELFNAFSYPIAIDSASVILPDGKKADLQFQENPNKKMESGNKSILKGTFPVRLEDNALKQFSFVVTYRSCAPELQEEPQAPECAEDQHNLSGRIIAKIVPPD